MNQEMLLIIDSIEREKGIPQEVLFEAIESALLSAAKKMLGKDRTDIKVKIDRETGELVVKAGAKKVDSNEFGRIAAQTAKQVIIQKMREAEREIVYGDFTKKVGAIVNGLVHRFEKGAIVVDLDNTEGILTRLHQIPREKYKQGDMIRAYVLAVEKTQRGPEIMLSRSDANFVKKLFEIEVPEIAEGIVEIRALAREAGERTKVAVYSKDEKVDAVGACVGMKGSRVKNIVKELHGERIDIVRWSDDLNKYLEAALSPAEISGIKLDKDKKRIEATVKEDQLSIAIGKHGQNVRLASRLIGWEIDVRAPEGMKKDSVPKGRKDEGTKDDKGEKGTEKKKGRIKKTPSIKKLDGVGKKAEKTLVEAGYDTVEKLAAADPKELTKLEGIGKKTAEKIVVSAKAITQPQPSDVSRDATATEGRNL